ncbi:MAG TPA: hypothetical protein VEI83_01375 [Acidimicrobiales bacterium]|nr:hypothetical protein [Acidimicrobiales bacterium]
MGGPSGSIGCDGTIIVHEDWSYICTDPSCASSESRIVAMGRHSWFLACRDVLGDACPVCRLVRSRREMLEGASPARVATTP